MYMHNTESVLKNGTNKIIRDFDKTDHLIPARRPNLDHRVKIKEYIKEKKRQVLRPCLKTKKNLAT